MRGAKTDKIRARDHDQIPTYGVGKDLSKPHWQTVFNQLLAAGHVWGDPARHGALRLGQSARAILKGEADFPYRKPNEKLLAASGASGAGSASGRSKKLPVVAPEDEGLLTDLKALRLDLAKDADVPAFVVFSDRSLMDMAAKRPQTREQMMSVNGVGPAKWEKFGRVFLELCQEAV